MFQKLYFLNSASQVRLEVLTAWVCSLLQQGKSFPKAPYTSSEVQANAPADKQLYFSRWDPPTPLVMKLHEIKLLECTSSPASTGTNRRGLSSLAWTHGARIWSRTAARQTGPQLGTSNPKARTGPGSHFWKTLLWPCRGRDPAVEALWRILLGRAPVFSRSDSGLSYFQAAH